MNNKKFELVKSMNTIVTANSNFLEQMAKNRTQIKIGRKTMGIAWELMEFGYDSFADIADPQALVQKESMDKLSLEFCKKLYIVNGFITEIIAGHITRIGRETDLARMPPEKGKVNILALQK